MVQPPLVPVACSMPYPVYSAAEISITRPCGKSLPMQGIDACNILSFLNM
jgi:hypothetical protein